MFNRNLLNTLTIACVKCAFTPHQLPLRIWMLVITLSASGCTSYTFKADIDPSGIPAHGLEPIPATVGLYFSDAFRAFEHSSTIYEDDSGGVYMEYSLGEPSVELFDKLFASTFRAIVHLGDDTGSIQLREIDGIIEPRIRSFSAESDGMEKVIPTYSASLTYEVFLRTPEGKQIAVWTGSSSQSKRARLFRDTAWGYAGEATEFAMRDIAAQFAIEFPGLPDVKEWINTLDEYSGALEGVEQ